MIVTTQTQLTTRFQSCGDEKIGVIHNSCFFYHKDQGGCTLDIFVKNREEQKKFLDQCQVCSKGFFSYLHHEGKILEVK
jgi:hypothetical protein